MRCSPGNEDWTRLRQETTEGKIHDSSRNNSRIMYERGRANRQTIISCGIVRKIAEKHDLHRILWGNS